MVKIVVSQNKERVAMIRKQLKENGGYCPCRIVKNDDTRCLCKEFLESVASGKTGRCHCGLYEAIEDGATSNGNIQYQKQYCEMNSVPLFIPTEGICYYCHKDIFDAQGWSSEDARWKHITYCPHCQKSFLD